MLEAGRVGEKRRQVLLRLADLSIHLFQPRSPSSSFKRGRTSRYPTSSLSRFFFSLFFSYFYRASRPSTNTKYSKKRKKSRLQECLTILPRVTRDVTRFSRAFVPFCTSAIRSFVTPPPPPSHISRRKRTHAVMDVLAWNSHLCSIESDVHFRTIVLVGPGSTDKKTRQFRLASSIL